MSLVFSDDMHIAIQTCPRVPTRHLRKVVKAYRKSVIFSFYIRGNIQEKSVVSIVPFARFLPVYVHFGVTHCPIELYENLFVVSKSRNIKGCAVPAHAHKRKPSRTTSVFNSRFLSILFNGSALNVVFHIKRTIDSPIVRHCNTLPMSIVISRFRKISPILSAKFPSFFKGLFLSPTVYSSQAYQ